MRLALTDRVLPKLAAPTRGRLDYVDQGLPGFALRVTANGVRSWTVLYRLRGRRCRVTLGTYPLVSLADARAKAKELLAQVVQGVDPSAERRADKEAVTFGELVESYLRLHAVKKRSAREDRRILAKYPPMSWAHALAKDITRRQVRALLDDLATRAPVQANRVLACLRKVWNFGLSRDLVEVNPCARIERPSAEHARTRNFTSEELRALWAAFEAEDGRTAALFKLLLLLGVRGGEARGLRWSDLDLDLDAAVWTLPIEADKTKKGRRIPLSTPALTLLRDLRAAAPEGAYVFPGFRADLKKAQRRIVAASSVADWRAHDLRAACGTGLALLGYSTDLIAAVLGHVIPGTTAKHYIRTTRENEVRTALEAWARKLEAIVSGESAKVVNLR